ncbi:Disease resistance protein [Quillaja saponaria]|uniref:Disease resistance protein n=1 Tax=Quillaja saponaria TaxID=32244 RepID=A0AAD7PC99_QUISA|nr:Disease resistance protein [Quillaja saponaria]
MADLGISVAVKIAEYLVNPAIRQARYLFCFNKFVADLEKEKKRLMSTRDGVQECVKEAIKRTEKIEIVVEKWLENSDDLIQEVEKLEEDMKVNMNCFLGCCPNYIWRYRLSKKVSKKREAMIELIVNSKFQKLSRLATLPGIDYFSSGNFVCFKSTKLAYDLLLEALKDDMSYMIGLFGMGGSGKTTLVKEEGKKAKESRLFDQVIFVVHIPNC